MSLQDRSEIFSRLWQGSEVEPGANVRGAGFDVLCVTAAGTLETPFYQTPQPFPGVLLLRIPLQDRWLSQENADKAEAMASRLATLHSQGARLLVVCQRGRNRSGLLSALTLCHRFGWSGRQALEQVQARRAGALSNPWFASYLLERHGGRQ